MSWNRIPRTAIAAIALLVAAPSFGAKATSPPAKPSTLEYQVRLKSPMGNMGTRTMYMKGSNYAFLMDSAGLKVTLIKNKDGVFLIHPKQRFIGKYPPGSNREKPEVLLPGPHGDVKAFLTAVGAKKTGKEKVDKKTCDVYEYTEKTTQWKCKLWLDPKTMTPAKLYMGGSIRGQNITATYSYYKRGVTIADSRFELPKNVPIRPMPRPDKAAATSGGAEKTPDTRPEAKPQ